MMRWAYVAIPAVGLLTLNAAAVAQDSVAVASGLPGDSPSAYQTTSGDSRQILRFAVDLAPKTSSWGGKYAIGPVIKASRSNTSGYFDQLIGAQAVSARFATGPLSSNQNYLLWSAAPGTGVNPPSNTLATQPFPGANRVGQHFGLAFMEFGAGADAAFGTGDDDNGVIGATIDFQYRRPNRLYVQRIVAAANKPSATASGTASFGIGAVDEVGNVHIYSDGFGMTATSRVTARALLRVRMLSRGVGVVNTVQGAGSAIALGDAASTDIIRAGSVIDTVPAIISAGLPGGAGRPVLLATDLIGNFVYESSAASASTTAAYLPGTGGSPRGSVCFIPQVYTPVAPSAGGGVGTCATLIRTNNNTTTRAIQVFGVASDGSVGGTAGVALPSAAGVVVDRDDGFDPGAALTPMTAHEFTNYASQASFRGGNSQVAMVQLPSGDMLVAATVAANGGGSAVPQSQDNYIAVARLPAAGGAPTWTIAAHTGASGFVGTGTGVASKTIWGRTLPTDPLAPIGRLARFTEVNGAASSGPSISSPALDLAGNLYFMATIGLTGPTTTFTTGLLRANFDPATNAYRLELLTSIGDVLPGLNSGKNYQVQYLGVADADSVDSGSVFSSSIVQDTVAGTAPMGASAPYASPRSLGALVLRAKIVYDMNGDGAYADPSGGGAATSSPDQAYNVAMIIMPAFPRGDFNHDQQVTVQDIFDFLGAWFGQTTAGDWNGDGANTVQDIFDFLADWFSGV